MVWTSHTNPDERTYDLNCALRKDAFVLLAGWIIT
jgi:hypothetical protein